MPIEGLSGKLGDEGGEEAFALFPSLAHHLHPSALPFCDPN
jgi:hypothetical protein